MYLYSICKSPRILLAKQSEAKQCVKFITCSFEFKVILMTIFLQKDSGGLSLTSTHWASTHLVENPVGACTEQIWASRDLSCLGIVRNRVKAGRFAMEHPWQVQLDRDCYYYSQAQTTRTAVAIMVATRPHVSITVYQSWHLYSSSSWLSWHYCMLSATQRSPATYTSCGFIQHK